MQHNEESDILMVFKVVGIAVAFVLVANIAISLIDGESHRLGTVQVYTGELFQ